jgi:hypothetical protein
MYSTLQDPLDSAARSSGPESEEASQRLAERLNVQNVPGKNMTSRKFYIFGYLNHVASREPTQHAGITQSMGTR